MKIVDKILWMCETMTLDLKFMMELTKLNNKRVNALLKKYVDEYNSIDKKYPADEQDVQG